jgi:hypothetical protein
LEGAEFEADARNSSSMQPAAQAQSVRREVVSRRRRDMKKIGGVFNRHGDGRMERGDMDAMAMQRRWHGLPEESRTESRERCDVCGCDVSERGGGQGAHVQVAPFRGSNSWEVWRATARDGTPRPRPQALA